MFSQLSFSQILLLFLPLLLPVCLATSSKTSLYLPPLSHLPKVVPSLPLPPWLTTTYLAGGVGAVVALALACFSSCLYLKYRLERTKKMEAIENAHKVA